MGRRAAPSLVDGCSVRQHQFVSFGCQKPTHLWFGARLGRGANVFWNAWAHKSAVWQPPTGRNYVFGKAYFNYGRKMVGNPKAPRSLYIKQLEERLGKQAVENRTTEAQRIAVTDPTSELARDRILWDPIKYGIGEQAREKEN